MDAVQKRLLKELRDAQREPNPQILSLGPVEDDELLKWRAVIAGSEDSIYAGGKFVVSIDVPPNYPTQPPVMKFVTKVCHPNVHWKTGEICLDLLKTAWSPAWTLQSACLAVAVLLTQPEPNSPLNLDAANLLRCGDMIGYNSLVRHYVQMFAMEEP